MHTSFIKIGLLVTMFIGASVASASSRKTPWLYNTRTMTAGEVEYEQWVTWKTNKKSDDNYDEIRFRHEIEWGLTDQIQMAIYFADWRHKETSSQSRTYFHDVAFETIFQLQAPTPDQLGAALYGEIKYGNDFVELEGKLLFEMEVDQVNFLYNLTLESEWEGESLDENKGVLQNAFAVTFSPDPSITFGVQAIWEIEFPEWHEQGEDVVSIGPSFAWQNDGWWVSISPLFQVTNVDSKPDLQVRFLFGIDF